MYCKNCGKPITSIATECPYCHERVIDDSNINDYNNSNYRNLNIDNDINKSQYKNSPIKNAISIILIIIGVVLTIEAIYRSLIWAGMIPTQKKGTTSSQGYITSIPSVSQSTTNKSSTTPSSYKQNYQQIYEEYSQKLINAGPTSSINEMAEICQEGVMKMAEYMYSASGTDGQYATYQDWVNKLTEVYLNNCR